MKTISETLRDLDPMLMASMVMEDPGHKARAKARTEHARRCFQAKAERELQEERRQREQDRKVFQARATRMVIDHHAATATLTVGALLAGYILALI